MIFDTNGIDCNIIRENELGVYDTIQAMACCVVKASCNMVYVKLKDNRELWLTLPKERIELK